MTPFGIFAPELNDLWRYLVTSKVNADCIVDCIERWWQQIKGQHGHIERLVINADNGPENSSRRTQFMKRLLCFAQREKLTAGLTILSHRTIALEWVSRQESKRYRLRRDAPVIHRFFPSGDGYTTATRKYK